MVTIRIRVTAETDGELHLRDLPVQQGQEAEVVIITNLDDIDADQVLLSMPRHDPAWAWLRDPAEDLYTEEDAR
jgi:hypothetical protein